MYFLRWDPWWRHLRRRELPASRTPGQGRLGALTPWQMTFGLAKDSLFPLNVNRRDSGRTRDGPRQDSGARSNHVQVFARAKEGGKQFSKQGKKCANDG